MSSYLIINEIKGKTQLTISTGAPATESVGGTVNNRPDSGVPPAGDSIEDALSLVAKLSIATAGSQNKLDKPVGAVVCALQTHRSLAVC